jgi:NAD(P)-dependent dehydrogenase (short-subunit alcohol dehydrogenase family)
MIIITGASRGIGKYLLEKYISERQAVIGLYCHTEPTNHVAHYHRVDISREDEVARFYQTIVSKLNHIVLINAAGTSYNAFAHKVDMDKWRSVIDINLTGLFNMVRLVLPIMRSNNYGRIINFSSVVAQQGVIGTSAYAATKSALWGMTKAIAAENGNKNITINNINPGYFDIGMINEVPQELLNSIIERIPSKRLGNPEELFTTVNYIIATPYLNGASIDLNGGLH